MTTFEFLCQLTSACRSST